MDSVDLVCFDPLPILTDVCLYLDVDKIDMDLDTGIYFSRSSAVNTEVQPSSATSKPALRMLAIIIRDKITFIIL